MQYRVPLTWKAVREHFRYHLWYYLLIAALSFGLWNIIYAQTAYRVPRDKRIGLYIQAGDLNQEAMNDWLDALRLTAVPEEEEVKAVQLMPSTSEFDYASTVQITSYLQVGEGDIYILSTKDFKHYATQGAFEPLEEAMAQGHLAVDGLNLVSGQVSAVDRFTSQGTPVMGDIRQYGIPASGLEGFAKALGVDPGDLVLAVAAKSANKKDSLAFLNAMIQETRASGEP